MHVVDYLAQWTDIFHDSVNTFLSGINISNYGGVCMCIGGKILAHFSSDAQLAMVHGELVVI